MAVISPVRALRYDSERIGDLSRVIAPPYDVIDAAEQEQLYHASPYNIIRLILGKQYPTDTPEDNRYTRAQRDFSAWMEQGILLRDPVPALYLIEHAFRDDRGLLRARLGFIALLQLGASIDQTAYRHEATLAAPKEDRTKLLRSVTANLEPIFCIYPDERGALQALLRDRMASAAPDTSAAVGEEEVRVWPITEEDVIQGVSRQLASSVVLIADGHHRFEVAYANRTRYGALMSYFVSMAESSLVVRPIHRIIQRETGHAQEALSELCLVEPVADLHALTQWLERSRGQGRFGYVEGQRLYQVQLKPEPLARWLMAPPVPLALAALDVSLLHGLILPRLGITTASNGTSGEGIRYTATSAEAIQAVTRGKAASAWLLRGIPLQQVYALAAQGLTLPPKSTYFYPKVPSGLTINPCD